MIHYSWENVSHAKDLLALWTAKLTVYARVWGEVRRVSLLILFDMLKMLYRSEKAFSLPMIEIVHYVL